MILPTVNSVFPVAGEHADHVARVVAVDARGLHSWDTEWDVRGIEVPSVTVLCSCDAMWVESFPEALVA